MFHRQRFIRVISIIIIIMLALSAGSLFARAGGAGGGGGYSGGSGGSSDGGAIIYILIIIFRSLPFPINWIFLIGLIVAVVAFGKKKTADSQAFQNYPAPPRESQDTQFKILDIPGAPFDKTQFLSKVEMAFREIQRGWSEQKLTGARRYMTDGIYQRFLTQFKMMDLLKQQNILKNLEVQRIWIDKAESQGSYQIVHCGIQAKVTDQFKSESFSQFNSISRESFIEYWTFLRRNNASGADLYSSVKCPNCGAPLEEENLDVVSCPFCSTLLNNGSFDWVLSEITQSSDWAASKTGLRKVEQVASKIRSNIAQEDFSVQLLEDKASNAFLQIKTAMTTGEPELMHRFVTQDFYQRLMDSGKDRNIAYNRLFLNHVTLIAAENRADRDILYVDIDYSGQRVELRQGKRPKLLDSYMLLHRQVVQMERTPPTGKAKGSLYGDSCPSCGSPVQKTGALECPSCGELYNSGKWDWVISDIMSLQEYQNRRSQTDISLGVDKLDSLLSHKDYVMNNLAFMIAADGVFDEKEKSLAQQICNKLGFSFDQLQPLFESAKTGKLMIRMPEDSSNQVKIFKLMEKMAHADNQLSSQEQAILEEVKMRYGIAS
ncbi:MAG: TIM44-like domain-containing protein [Spirochaetaceae bacterium]|jgi:uncharacterized Zn finger protein (UPF0148 family)/predicted lipid-binding transport protein (Tim44 family)/uncharacterized tellurite resistance protein B-like protein|nr:TIM44-like domain-containing protein [Spirochaetaceae bacterium]